MNAEILDYIRREALTRIKGAFSSFKIYESPSIDYTTLFLAEHPEFCEQLEKEQDKAIPELDGAVKNWASIKRKELQNDIPDYIKELCVLKSSFLRRTEIYATIEVKHGFKIHGRTDCFAIGQEEPGQGFSWFLDKASLNMPISIPALSYSGKNPCVRKTSFLFDTAVKKHILKNPEKYGIEIPQHLKKEDLLDGLENKQNLKYWLLHEEGEGKKTEYFKADFEEQSQATNELAANYHALLNADKTLTDMILLDCMLRTNTPELRIFAEALLSSNPRESLKQKIMQLLE